MRFLEYLFFKYYNWQVKVRNGDMPTFMAVLFITFCSFFYFLNIVMSFDYFLFGDNTTTLSKWYFIAFTIILLILEFFLFVYKGRDKMIMETHREEWTGKKNLGAILFPAIAFVWFNVNWIVKMLMNRGAL